MKPRTTFVAQNRIPRPRISGDYVNIYQPQRWTMEEDTRAYNKGETFDTWVTNDHAFMRTESGWHIIGITGPKPDDLVDDYHFGAAIHDAEEQLFHAYADGNFKALLHDDAFTDYSKVLYPSTRPTGLRANAPHLIEWQGEYRIIIGPTNIRAAASADLFTFGPLQILFEGTHPTTRDPNIFIDDDGTIVCLYACENSVRYRTSRDMESWSEEQVLQVNPWQNGTCESPFMFKRDGIYYLFWCIWDQTCGCYDNRTFVFGAESMDALRTCSPLTILQAHAPEIIVDEGGDTYISSALEFPR